MEETVCCIMVEKKNAKKMKDQLESTCLLRKDYKISKVGNLAALPIAFMEISDAGNIHTLLQSVCPFEVKLLHHSKLYSNHKTHSELLHSLASSYLSELAVSPELKKELLSDLPNKWDIYGDLIMFPDSSFTFEYWKNISEEFWKEAGKIFGATRIAVKSRINKGDYRVPKVVMKLGENGVIETVDNGIRYTFDVTKNMFSKGNITEKLRVSKLSCKEEVVVDLFAGIGYFTLPFLKGGVKTVFACDWNPDAIFFLKQNLSLNQVADRCVVLEGDNRKVAPKNVADRVNLGLIPSSSCSWKVACESLKRDSGGWLHIHENIDSKIVIGNTCDCSAGKCVISKVYSKSLNDSKRIKWCDFVKRCTEVLEGYLPDNWTVLLRHIEYVKSYAPHVDHLVFDFECRPKDWLRIF